MYKNLRIRLALCGKKCVDVIKVLHTRKEFKGITAPSFSRAVNEYDNTPMSRMIREEADKIVEQWEREQGREPFTN